MAAKGRGTGRIRSFCTCKRGRAYPRKLLRRRRRKPAAQGRSGANKRVCGGFQGGRADLEIRRKGRQNRGRQSSRREEVLRGGSLAEGKRRRAFELIGSMCLCSF